MKLTYFDCYALGEPIRMLLHLAKVDYEDIRFSYEKRAEPGEFNDWKKTVDLPFGQVPLLELDDGTKMAQSWAILTFLSSKYGFMPEDPMRRYRGEAAKDHFYQDFWTKDAKWAIWYAAEEEQRGMIEKLCNDQLPTYLAQFEKFLSQSDDKFITGNEFTVYDLFVGGFFVNSFMNPNANHADIVLAAMEKAPERVKKYITDFQAEMAEYLASRPKCIY